MDKQLHTLVKQILSKDCVAKIPRGDTASPDRATARLAQGADANQPATCSMLMPPRPPRRLSLYGHRPSCPPIAYHFQSLSLQLH